MLKTTLLAGLLLMGLGALPVWSQEKLPTEDDYYPLTALDPPPGVVLESGAIELLPDDKIAVASRRGEVYIVSGAYEKEYPDAKFQLFASGLHEVLGLAYRDGWLYVTQRCEVTRLKDVDGDGRADKFETVSDGWGINGDYHEYAFGSTFDREGNIWVTLCLTGSFTADSTYRGFCLRVTPDGKTIPTCSGLRSPGGVGMNDVGDMFYTDNQGPWNGTCGLKHLKPGGFMGHPVSFKFYEISDALGAKPEEPKSGSRIHIERQHIPQLVPTAVMFPYKKMGQSASGIATDMTKGKFGPFAGQMFVGDQTFSTVMRVDLEQVNGVYQGACFPFRSGIGSGSLGMRFAPTGELFVGGTNRGWGSRGGKQYSLDRINWSGKVPFEIHQMRVMPDGFELRFTEPVDKEACKKIESYNLQTYTYIYQSSYGSPEVDHTQPKIESATVSEDGLRVKLKIEGLQLGHVHELHATGVRSKAGLPLLHAEAYYTLNEMPGQPSVGASVKPKVSAQPVSVVKPVEKIPPGTFVKRINCGGAEFVGADGIAWEADKERLPGSQRWLIDHEILDAGELSPLYQSERWSNDKVSYEVPVEPGKYRVTIHFAETNRNFQAAGKRAFDVLVDGDKRFTAVDVFAEVGGYKPYVVSTDVFAIDPAIKIELRNVKLGPAIKAIEVRGLPEAE